MSFYFFYLPKNEKPTGYPYEDIEAPIEPEKPARRKKKKKAYKIILEKRKRKAVEISLLMDWLDDD